MRRWHRNLQIILWVSSCLPGVSWATDEVNVTAEDLPNLVRSKNQSVSGARALTEAARQRTGHLVRSFLPSVNAIAGAETFRTGPYERMTQPFGGVEARINLFQGGRDSLEEDLRQQQAVAIEAQEGRTFNVELQESRRVFWSLVFTREVITTLKDSESLNEKNLTAANRRISRGLAAKTDRLEFEINRSQIREEIESLQHEAIILVLKLAPLLGLPIDTHITTPNQLPHDHHDSEVATKPAPESNPEVKLLRANSVVAGNQRGIYRRSWLPSLDVYSEYVLHTFREREYTALQDRRDLAVGVRLSLNLFDGMQSRNAASSFAIQAEGLEMQAAQRARAVESQHRVAQEEMKHDHELIHESEKRVEQGRAYLASTLEEYDRGVKNSPDVLSATEKLTGFRRRLSELKRDYQISRAGLLAVVGQ